jgi:rRNA maturation endonuclease Nob1
MTAGIAGLPQNGGVTSQSFINNCDRSVEVSCCNVSVGEFSIADSASINDAGITVPGSESNQKFSMVSSFYTEDEKHVIVLKLVGVTERGVQYVAPVTVQAKPTCQTCGRVNKATSKFCSECGTSLVIL